MQTPTTPEQDAIFEQLENIVKTGNVSPSRLAEHVNKLKHRRRPNKNPMPANQKRNITIAFRVNKTEQRTLKRLSKEKSLSVGKLVRELLLEQAAEKGIK